MLTGGQTQMAKLTVAFRSSANAPRKSTPIFKVGNLERKKQREERLVEGRGDERKKISRKKSVKIK
jgi:hypothetical protein